MIHSFRRGTGAVTLVSALAVAGLAPGLPAPAHAADGQPVPQPRWQQPKERPKSLVRPARPAKAEKARKKKRRAARPVEARRPEIRLDMGGPEGPLVPGRTYEWPYSITNLGSERAEEVFFVAPVPYDLEFVSGQGNCSMQGKDVVCAVGPLGEGKTHTGTITTKVAESAKPATTVQGKVTVEWSGGTTHGSFPAHTVSPTSDLVVTADGPAQLQPGQKITYTFTVENRGPSPATGVTVSAPAASPPQTAVQVEAGQGCTAQAGQGVTCQLGTLEAQQSKTFHVVFRATPKASPGLIYVRRFEAVSGVPDLHPEDNHATVRPTVIRYLPTRDREEFPGPVRPRPMPHLPQDAPGPREAPERPAAPAPAAPAPAAPAAPVPAPRTAVEELPDTGSDTQSRVDLALALLGTGLILVGIGARRRRAGAR
ncbi:COG1361 family protein [Actinocorallia populi]|uniref:DUF11 domain-containing protein n=1 Tax=Actinocorallia populi TaxID=2079200 RepID=UPI000D096D32|nr:DUF11 domain-containing protein [Actinocorallia populi]